MDYYQEFCQFMAEYANLFDSMLVVEKEKLEALLSHELGQMERSIAAQQAAAMKLENFEKKRLEVQARAGFGGKTFQEILDMVDPQQSAELDRLFRRLEDAVNNVKFYNDRSMELVKMNLHTLNQTAPPQEREEAKGYTQTKEKPHTLGGQGLFETKI